MKEVRIVVHYFGGLEGKTRKKRTVIEHFHRDLLLAAQSWQERRR